jgi:hypothetical protein
MYSRGRCEYGYFGVEDAYARGRHMATAARSIVFDGRMGGVGIYDTIVDDVLDVGCQLF